MAGDDSDPDQPDAPDEAAEGSDGQTDSPDPETEPRSDSSSEDAGRSETAKEYEDEEEYSDENDVVDSSTEPGESDDEAVDDTADDGDNEAENEIDDGWESWFYGEKGPPEADEIDHERTEEVTTDDGRGQGIMGFDTPVDDAQAASDAQAKSHEPPHLTPEEGGMAGGLPGRSAPDSDREMPLTDHVQEMLKRLAVVIAIAGIVSLVTFPFAERLINIIWYGILPGTDVARPRVYGILALKLTELKVASLAGVIVALPILVYETYQFMRPGLYPHERRYYLAAIPTSLVLALVGVAFAFFIVLPAIFIYFLHYSETVATIGFGLMRTFDLILLLMGYLAVVFQIPLFILLAMMMGIVTRQWLADRRLLFWGAFLGISFLFSPDPTGMAPIIVALTMIVLFEGTLLLTRWTGR